MADMTRSGASARKCERCCRPLSRYNDGDYCGGCAKAKVRDSEAHASDAGIAEIGARLRALRLRRGMTLDVLAGLVGLSSAYLCMIENGKRKLDRYSLIVALADVLGVSPGELVPGVVAGGQPASSGSSASSDRPATAVGGRIAELRRERNLTQELLAERAGLSVAMISKVEQDARRPSLATLSAIADALGMPPGDLINQGAPEGGSTDSDCELTDAAPTAMRRNRLAERRKAAGFSQEQLAESLHIDRSTIGRWENGETVPQLWMRPKLAKALRVSADQLNDLLIEMPPSVPNTRNLGSSMQAALPVAAEMASFVGLESIDDMNRRELLRLMSIVGAMTAGVYQTDVLNADKSASVDRGRSDDVVSLNDHLWQVFVLSRAKHAVLPLARDHLDSLIARIPGAGSTAEYRRLCGIASSAFQLSGEILFDGNLYTEAAHCYSLAASAAREAGAYDLWACALTRHAFIGMYEGHFLEASPLLDVAASIARRGDQALATRYWVASVQAQAFAGLGDLPGCQRALDAAARVRTLGKDAHNGGWMRFDGSRLAEEQGTCYLRLHRLDLAQVALTEALGQDLSARRRGGVLADLLSWELSRKILTRRWLTQMQQRRSLRGLVQDSSPASYSDCRPISRLS